MRLSKKKTHKRYKKKLRGGVNPPSSHSGTSHYASSHPSLFNPPPSHPSLFIRPSLFPQPIDPNDLTFKFYEYNASQSEELYSYVIKIGLLDADNECFRNLYEPEELPPNDAIFDMLYNEYTDLWICTDNTRNNTYVAHASVNYDKEIGYLQNFPPNNSIIEPEYKCNLIWNVCVSLAYRRKKICELLIKTILSPENRLNDLYFALNVVRNNTGAMKCYESSGFKFFTTNESMNIMTTIPGLPEYIPIETHDEEDMLCQGLSDMKVKGKIVFLYIISHGLLLPIPQGGRSDYIAAKNMCEMVASQSQDEPLITDIFPVINNNQNLLDAANGMSFNPLIFPFYLSDSKLKKKIIHTHTMNLLALQSGCINLMNFNNLLFISNLLSTSIGNERLNNKVVFDELTRKLNEHNNSCVSRIVKSCISVNEHPITDYDTHKLLKSANKCHRVQSRYKKTGMNMVFSTDAVKAMPNWPDGNPKLLQNNKVYTNLYPDIEGEDKVKYDQIANLVQNDTTGYRVDYHRNPLIKLYFKTDRVGDVDGVDVFLNVPTHEYITLTDVLNRVSRILNHYGMNNTEIVIVDNSCSQKNNNSFAYKGGKTKKNKNIYKKKRRTVRRPLRG